MNQPPESPQSPPPPDRPDSAGPQPGRRPNASLVAIGLLVLVLVLSLAAFFGVRAFLGEGEPAEQPPTSQSAAALA